MAEERKFLFEVSFDEPKPQEDVEEAVPEDAPEEVIAPTFSEADMRAARDEAFAVGKAEGVAEAAEATEQAILGVLEKVEAHFTELFKAEEESQNAVTEDAIVVAVGIVRKIFPSLNERQAQAEIERMVRTAMERILEDPKVIVYIAPELVEPLNARLEMLATQAAYTGDVEVVAHADIAKGDCRVEWTGGGASRITDELWREIDEIVERNLARTDDESLIEEPDAVADLAPPPSAAGAPEAEVPESGAEAKVVAEAPVEKPVETPAPEAGSEAPGTADAADAAPEGAADAPAPEITEVAPPANAVTSEDAVEAPAEAAGETPAIEDPPAAFAAKTESERAAETTAAATETAKDDAGAPEPGTPDVGLDAPAGDDTDTDREQP